MNPQIANSTLLERLTRLEAKLDLLLEAKEDVDFLKHTVHLPVYDHQKPWVKRESGHSQYP